MRQTERSVANGPDPQIIEEDLFCARPLGVMGASTDDQILQFIAHKVAFYKTVFAGGATSTSDLALGPVREPGAGRSLHFTGPDIGSSTQTGAGRHVRSRIQRDPVRSDRAFVPTRPVLRDDEESDGRTRCGPDLVLAGQSAAERVQCSGAPEHGSDQRRRAGRDQSLTDYWADLAASQEETTEFQSDREFAAAAHLPRPPCEGSEGPASPCVDGGGAVSDGSCETEDSCDYSSGTGDRRASLGRPRERLSQEVADPFENQNEEFASQAPKVQSRSCFQKLKELMVAKKLSDRQRNGKQPSSETSIITIESDSEDDGVAGPEAAIPSSGWGGGGGDPPRVEHQSRSHLSGDVIVIDSDTEDGGDQDLEKMVGGGPLSSVAEDNTSVPTAHQQGPRETGAAEPELDAEPLRCRSASPTVPEEALEGQQEGTCVDWLLETQTTGSEDVCGQVGNGPVRSVTFDRTQNPTSTPDGSDDSGSSTPSPARSRGPNPETHLQPKKPQRENPAKPPSEPRVGFPTRGGRKPSASQRDPPGFCRNKTGEPLSQLRLGPPLNPGVERHRAQSSRLSPTSAGDRPSSTSRSVLNRGGSLEGRKRSPPAGAAGRTPSEARGTRGKRVTFSLEPPSPLRRLARSTSAPSTCRTSATLDQPVASTRTAPRMKVLQDWSRTHYSNRMERKYVQNLEAASRAAEAAKRPSNTDAPGPVGPEPAHHSEAPRQRRRSQDSSTRLMKRCKTEAAVLSNTIHRRTQAKSESSIVLHSGPRTRLLPFNPLQFAIF